MLRPRELAEFQPPQHPQNLGLPPRAPTRPQRNAAVGDLSTLATVPTSPEQPMAPLASRQYGAAAALLTEKQPLWPRKGREIPFTAADHQWVTQPRRARSIDAGVRPGPAAVERLPPCGSTVSAVLESIQIVKCKSSVSVEPLLRRNVNKAAANRQRGFSNGRHTRRTSLCEEGRSDQPKVSEDGRNSPGVQQPSERTPGSHRGSAKRRQKPRKDPSAADSSPASVDPSSRKCRHAIEDPGQDKRSVALCGWSVLFASSQCTKVKQQGGHSIRLLGSVFAGRPPVLFFDYEPACGASPRASNRVLNDEQLKASGFDILPRMYFSLEETRDCHAYNATLNTLAHNGLERVATGVTKFALLWGIHPTPELLRSFHPFQRTNHFPASFHLGRKDLLSKLLSKTRRKWPQEYDITPAGFVLPNDMQAWQTAREQNPGALWIWKPVSLACGKGIRLFRSAVPADAERKLAQKPGVVQRYVDRPMLINGFKFDLRLYVVVTSYDPLRVYLSSEGLVRMATERYSTAPETLRHRTMHLTNYSVNKHAVAYSQNMDGKEACGEHCPDSAELPARDLPSSKWSLNQFSEYCKGSGLDYEQLMHRIKDLIVKTLIAVETPVTTMYQQGANFTSTGVSSPQVVPNQTCFEIYGFDVLMDEDLKPWLLEVNVFPSFSSSSPLDKRIKTTLMADVLTLVGFFPFDHEVVERTTQEEQIRRLQGRNPKTTNISRSHTVQSVSSAALCDLGEAEWRLIQDSYDEYMRRGSLERIFPRQELLGSYDRFFTAPRYANLVLARWLQAGEERCFLPEARTDVPPWLPQQLSFDAC